VVSACHVAGVVDVARTANRTMARGVGSWPKYPGNILAYGVLRLELVRSRRLELPRVLPHSDLNAARLPIPPRPHSPGLVKGGLVKPPVDLKRHFSPGRRTRAKPFPPEQGEDREPERERGEAKPRIIGKDDTVEGAPG
jgi:hypothetical protein